MDVSEYTPARDHTPTPSVESRRTGRQVSTLTSCTPSASSEPRWPHLERSDAASIIAISSVSGRESDFASGPYGTAKTAIVGYIRGLAFQLAERNIRANTVSPGNTYFEGGVCSIETGNPPSSRPRWA
jgi:NAD(P)-dependent dehydrogenase (short-subunit alcohol dehydrogenase family)